MGNRRREGEGREGEREGKEIEGLREKEREGERERWRKGERGRLRGRG